MKKSFKILGMLLAIAAMPLMYSCEDEDEFVPGEPDLDDCYGVYFPDDQGLSSLEVDPADPFETTITVARVKTSGAITVPYVLTDETGIFSATDIVFADGEEETEIILSFEAAETGESYSCLLEITDPLYASTYNTGLTGLDVSVSIVKWESLGYAEFCDWWMFWNENEDTTLGGYMVEVQQNSLQPNYFRLIDPYKEGMANPYEGYYVDDSEGNWVFRILEPGTTLAGVTITMEDLVYFEPYNSGWFYDYYGDYVWVYHPAHWTSYAAESYWTHSCVLSYQEDGTPGLVQFAPYYYIPGVGGWPNYDEDEVIWILFPGADLLDYSAEVEYIGRDEEFNVTAYVTLGDNVESARVAFIEGNDVESAAKSVQRGTIEYMEITESGEVSFFCDQGGTYSIVVDTYNGGAYQEYGYVTFKLVDPNETWSLYGVGDYEYTIWWYGTDEDLEIYQSNSDPERFKITDWGLGVDFVFTWNQSTNEVVVEDQDTGDTYGRYGSVYVDDLSDYLGTGSGFYKNGTFYFMVTYYCSGGSFGYGSETFTITGGASLTLNDLLGTYIGEGLSYYGPEYDETEYWIFEESDDASKGNFMMTVYNGWVCDAPIYGTFDPETGSISIETGTMGVYFASGSTFDYYFLSYDAYYYGGRYGTSVEMVFLPNGSFYGPLEGDLICELAYYNGSPYDWNQIFEFVYGTKVSAGATALSVPAQTDSKKEFEAKDKEVVRKALRAPKTAVEKTATVAKNSSAEAKTAVTEGEVIATSSHGKGILKSQKPAPVSTPAPKSVK